MADSSQKFIARNRAPRVQIEYDVEVYGSEKKIQLPFVMGVFSDLSGKSQEPQPALEDRNFLEIDADNFDSRMRAMMPRAAFTVPNTLTGEGSLAVDLTFEKMDDFAPAAIASKVEPLRKLLEARTQLSNLMTYMDGKAGAEDLILKMMQDPAVLQALAGKADDTTDHQATLSALRDSAPADAAPDDDATDVLDGLRASAPEAAEAEDHNTTDATLDALRSAAPQEAEDTDETGDVLESLRELEPDTDSETDAVEDTLAELRSTAPPELEAEDSDASVLDALRDAAPEDVAKDGGLDGVLDELREAAPTDVASEDETGNVLEALRDAVPDQAPEADTSNAALEGLRSTAPEGDTNTDDTSADVLDALREAAPDSAVGDDHSEDVLDALREAAPADQDNDAAENAGNTEDLLDGLDDLLADDARPDSEEEVSDGSQAGDGDGKGDDELNAPVSPEAGADPDDTTSVKQQEAAEPADTDVLAELDSLLDDGGAGIEDGAETPEPVEIAETNALPEPESSGSDEENVVQDTDGDGSADLIAPPDSNAGTEPSVNVAAASTTVELSFGTLSEQRPEREVLPDDKFRLAVFGDFSGRAARGKVEIGDALAKRRPIRFDIDNVEDVIGGFATTLVLPIGKDRAGIEVKLTELDDLHPDELYENVEIFAELSGLRQRLQMGSMAPAAIAELQGWGEEFGTLKLGSRGASAGNAVPADRPISAFADLIGDTEGRLAQPSPAGDLIARIVAPHVVAAESSDTAAMISAVDEALSQAMRLILHNPEFQSIESQWRSLDLLARRVESDTSLELVLYDVSAEEIAADLAANDDLAQSGLLRLLTEAQEERGEVGYAALFGLYTFEETPPHAELLARVSRIAAHVNAPFFTSITPAFLKTPKKDRHPLVTEAWEKLRDMPEAKYLGVASPRFLLRRPYGAKTEPIDAFDFEEFTLSEGLRGMLWANPVVLVAILLATTRKKGGNAMQLGSTMSIGDIPFHYINDEYGDQVALPCTERILTTQKMEIAATRGLMPVLAIQGRDEVRLGSFQSVGRGEILGRWSGAADIPPPPSPAPPPVAEAPPSPVVETEPAPEIETETAPDIETAPEPSPEQPEPVPPPAPSSEQEPEAAAEAATSDTGDDDLDALLASFGDDEELDQDPGEMDAELAALLEDL